MTKLTNKDREQMKNMLKQRWLKPSKPTVKRNKNKKPSIPERTPRKLIIDKPITTQTVLIRLTYSGSIPMAVMEYVVNDKDIIIDKKSKLALIEIRLTQQDMPKIPAHVRRHLVEEVELEDKKALEKEFKGVNYIEDYIDDNIKKPIELVEELAEKTIEAPVKAPIEAPVEEIVTVPSKSKLPKHVQEYIYKEVEKENKILTTLSQPTIKKSDKIIIPMISFSIWRLAIKFTIEFKR